MVPLISNLAEPEMRTQDTVPSDDLRFTHLKVVDYLLNTIDATG
jgi:hypothetical protein